MSNVWIYQRPQQVRTMGEDVAPWYVGYYDPNGKRKGKSCGSGPKGKQNACKLADRIKAQLLTGTYNDPSKKTWADFRQEYESKVLAGAKPQTRRLTLDALDHFERVIKPARVYGIKTADVDGYVAVRRGERGKQPGETVSLATINKELRHLRAAFRKAFKWGLMPEVPDFAFQREARKLPVIIPPDHFAAVYQKCDDATRPAGLAYPPGDWWRALLVFAYMTGWRISEMLRLRREDLDLNEGRAVTRAADNKAGRDEAVTLHPIVVERLRAIPSFGPTVFPWNSSERELYTQFEMIQKAAGVRPPPGKSHYTFHDLRRAFATMNVDRLSAEALQALMRHKSYLTTQRYIAMARRMDEAVAELYVPDLKATLAKTQRHAT